MRTDCHKHIFVLLFCMSLCANIALTVMLTSENSYQIQTGTYCTGDGKSADDTYLVIDKRGKFFVYQQFGQVETGSYTSPYHHVLMIRMAVISSYFMTQSPFFCGAETERWQNTFRLVPILFLLTQNVLT